MLAKKHHGLTYLFDLPNEYSLSQSVRYKLPCLLRSSLLFVMAFCELLDHLFVEGRDVVGLAAGD